MIVRADRKAFSDEIQHRRGRPRREMPIVQTSLKIPEDVYDAICRIALRRRESVHALLLEAVEEIIRDRRSSN